MWKRENSGVWDQIYTQVQYCNPLVDLWSTDPHDYCNNGYTSLETVNLIKYKLKVNNAVVLKNCNIKKNVL
jgi:hypothetical protein